MLTCGNHEWLKAVGVQWIFSGVERRENQERCEREVKGAMST